MIAKRISRNLILSTNWRRWLLGVMKDIPDWGGGLIIFIGPWGMMWRGHPSTHSYFEDTDASEYFDVLDIKTIERLMQEMRRAWGSGGAREYLEELRAKLTGERNDWICEFYTRHIKVDFADDLANDDAAIIEGHQPVGFTVNFLEEDGDGDASSD